MWWIWPDPQPQEDRSNGPRNSSPPSVHIGDYNLNRVSHFQYLGSTYLPTSHWNLRSTPWSPKLLGWCLNWRRGCRPTTTWGTTLRCRFTEPVSSAPCCIQVRRGPPTLPRKRGWTASTSAAFGASSASAGRYVFPTLKYSSGYGYPPSLPCWLSAACGGLAMCAVWMIATSPDLLYSKLANGARAWGRPTLRYKDTCKRDMRDVNININT